MKTSILSSQIVEYIVNEIKLIPNYETLSQDLHLLTHICYMIENLQRSDLSPKLDKKTLFLEIIKAKSLSYFVFVNCLYANYSYFYNLLIL